jgi:hypothetical protein
LLGRSLDPALLDVEYELAASPLANDAPCANLPVVTMSTDPQMLAGRVAAHLQMPFDLDHLCAALHRFSEPKE